MNKNTILLNALAEYWRKGEKTIMYSGRVDKVFVSEPKFPPDLVWYDEVSNMDWNTLLELLQEIKP